MFFFKKKPKPKVLLLPEEYEIEVRELADEYEDDGHACHVSHYRYHKKIQSIFPELKGKDYQVSYSSHAQTKIYVHDPR